MTASGILKEASEDDIGLFFTFGSLYGALSSEIAHSVGTADDSARSLASSSLQEYSSISDPEANGLGTYPPLRLGGLIFNSFPKVLNSKRNCDRFSRGSSLRKHASDSFRRRPWLQPTAAKNKFVKPIGCVSTIYIATRWGS